MARRPFTPLQVVTLRSIGGDTVIGGDVTLVARSAESGWLVTAPIAIGARVAPGVGRRKLRRRGPLVARIRADGGARRGRRTP